MAKGNHSFTEQDIHSRFNAIVGHTVAEVDTAGVLTASSASRNKGRVGAVIEQSVLGYPADSDRRPDILIDGQPWEVKATGLVEVARGGWRAKEPMSITAVAPEGIVAESFTTSAFWHKAARLLVVYYLYVRPGRGVAVEYAGFEFKGYDLHTWREVDRCRLEADWTVVRDFVRTALEGDIDTEMPNLSTLVNPQLLYLDTSPKWPNRPRFRLKASLVTQMARERLDDDMGMIPDQGGLSSMGDLRAHLHDISNAHAGQTLEDLAAQFDLPLRAKSGKENKSLAEQVVVRLFTGHAGKISQVPLFAKASLAFKTMTLTPAGGRTEGGRQDRGHEAEPLDRLRRAVRPIGRVRGLLIRGPLHRLHHGRRRARGAIPRLPAAPVPPHGVQDPLARDLPRCRQGALGRHARSSIQRWPYRCARPEEGRHAARDA